MGSLRRSAFLKRLNTELPGWVRRGWVLRKHQQSILDYVAQQERKPPRSLVAVLPLMGALLFGAGVITFFAANWSGMPKAMKLVVLFGALAGSYAASGVCADRGRAALAQGFLLLGTILFGANIFLIAQVYHIDAHYPNGILLWGVGGLLTAALGRSQVAAAAALGLIALWSATEMLQFGRTPHWAFFIPWSLALALVHRYRWLIALRAACWALLAWCFMVFAAGDWSDRRWSAGEQIALLQVYVFSGIALYILGRGMSWYGRWSRFAPPVITAGAVWAVAALFALTFPRLQHQAATDPVAPASYALWLGVTVLVLAVVAALMVWRYWDTRLSTLPLYRQGAFLWLILAGAFALANLLSTGAYSGAFAIAYNVLAFAGVVWLVMTGVDRGESRVVNLGFLFFAALLVSRYFDTFWTLLDRSYFFMIGGAVLLLAGFFIERSRRRVTARIAAAKAES
jgi:uncharacterized membrane protein